MLRETGINPETRVRDLTEEEVVRLREYIDRNLKIEGDLRREVSQNIKRLMEIGCYRGLRHRKGLPGPRPAHAHERAHPQGSASPDRREEEGQVSDGSQEEDRPDPTSSAASARTSPSAGAHQEHVQQHDHQHHGPLGQRDLLAVGRHRGLQGLAQVHAVRRADGRRGGRQDGAGARPAQGPRVREGPGFGPRDRHPLAAGGRPRDRRASRTARPSRTTAAGRASAVACRLGRNSTHGSIHRSGLSSVPP